MCFLTQTVVYLTMATTFAEIKGPEKQDTIYVDFSDTSHDWIVLKQDSDWILLDGRMRKELVKILTEHDA